MGHFDLMSLYMEIIVQCFASATAHVNNNLLWDLSLWRFYFYPLWSHAVKQHSVFPLQDAGGESSETRSRRFYQHRAIPVADEASVMYEDGVVKVRVGEALVYRVAGVHVLQVYNDIEGYLTFYGTANGRSFPGYGMADTEICFHHVSLMYCLCESRCPEHWVSHCPVHTRECSISGVT